MWFAGKTYNFIFLHCSTSHSHHIFETFAENLKLNLDMIAKKNSYLIVMLGQFNAKSSN